MMKKPCCKSSCLSQVDWANLAANAVGISADLQKFELETGDQKSELDTELHERLMRAARYLRKQFTKFTQELNTLDLNKTSDLTQITEMAEQFKKIVEVTIEQPLGMELPEPQAKALAVSDALKAYLGILKLYQGNIDMLLSNWRQTPQPSSPAPG